MNNKKNKMELLIEAGQRMRACIQLKKNVTWDGARDWDAALPAMKAELASLNEPICCEQCSKEITNKTYLCIECWNSVASRGLTAERVRSLNATISELVAYRFALREATKELLATAEEMPRYAYEERGFEANERKKRAVEQVKELLENTANAALSAPVNACPECGFTEQHLKSCSRTSAAPAEKGGITIEEMKPTQLQIERWLRIVEETIDPDKWDAGHEELYEMRDELKGVLTKSAAAPAQDSLQPDTDVGQSSEELAKQWPGDSGRRETPAREAVDLMTLARDIVVTYDLHCEQIDDPDPDWLAEEILSRFAARDTALRQNIEALQAKWRNHVGEHTATDDVWTGFDNGLMACADELDTVLALLPKPAERKAVSDGD
jgi:hypothetical protein